MYDTSRYTANTKKYSGILHTHTHTRTHARTHAHTHTQARTHARNPHPRSPHIHVESIGQFELRGEISKMLYWKDESVFDDLILQERLWAGDKVSHKSIVSHKTNLSQVSDGKGEFGSPPKFSWSKAVVCGHCLVTLSLTINEWNIKMALIAAHQLMAEVTLVVIIMDISMAHDP